MTVRDESTLYGSQPCGEVSIIKSRSELFNSCFVGCLTERKVRGPFVSRSNIRPFTMMHCTLVSFGNKAAGLSSTWIQNNRN